MWGTYYTFGVFFESLLAEYGWTRVVISGAYSLSLILSGLLSIVMGRINDQFGPRVVVTGCGIFLGSGYLLMSQLSAIWQLYLFYGVVVAFGISGAFVPIVSTIARWFIKKRGMMTGFVVAGVGAGTMVMVPVVRWLISSYNWRTSYIIIGVATLVVIVSAAQFLKRDPMTIKLLPLGSDDKSERSLNSKVSGFSLIEAVRTKRLWLLCGVFFFGFFSIGTILVHIVIHVTGLGLPSITASSILATIGGVSIAGRVITGTFSDRIGNKKSLNICLILLSVSLILVMVAKEEGTLYLFAVIIGFAYGGINLIMSLIAAEMFGTLALGAIIGIIFASDSVGGAIGPVIAGRIFDVNNNYHLAFIVCFVAALIALILLVFLRPTSNLSGGKRVQ